MKKIVVKGLCLFVCLGLAGCGSMSPKAVVKKGGHYVRDRENDYHTSYFVPTIRVPEGLSPLDPNREQMCSEGAQPGVSVVNIEPPGVL